MSENTNTNTKSKIGSDVEVVDADSINVDIVFDEPTIPQVGIEQRIDSRLISSQPPALFSERRVTWYRVNDNSRTLTTNERYTPDVNDQLRPLRIDVEYLSDSGQNWQSSIDTQPVSPDPVPVRWMI